MSTRRKRARPASQRVPAARRGECGAGVQGKSVGRRRSGPLGAQPSRDRGSGLPGPRLLRSLVAPRWSASSRRAATPWAPATAAARVLSADSRGSGTRHPGIRNAWKSSGALGEPGPGRCKPGGREARGGGCVWPGCHCGRGEFGNSVSALVDPQQAQRNAHSWQERAGDPLGRRVLPGEGWRARWTRGREWNGRFGKRKEKTPKV